LRYKEAVDQSVDIEWTNPLRLAVYLNYTVYLAEVKLDFKEAIAQSKLALDECLMVYSSLEKDKHTETTRCMALLQNNIEIWKLDKAHIDRIHEVEDLERITKALAERGLKMDKKQHDKNFENIKFL
jgi:hypothetical protein